MIITHTKMKALAKELEAAAIRFFNGISKPAFQIVFTFPGDDDPHWIGNTDRTEGRAWLLETAEDIAGAHEDPAGITSMKGKFDLTPLMEEMEQIMARKFGGRPGLLASFTLPPDYNYTWWITNLRQPVAIKYINEVALKMITHSN